MVPSEYFNFCRKIGVGGLAEVYEVKRMKDGKNFAAKRFSKEKTYGNVCSHESLKQEI